MVLRICAIWVFCVLSKVGFRRAIRVANVSFGLKLDFFGRSVSSEIAFWRTVCAIIVSFYCFGLLLGDFWFDWVASQAKWWFLRCGFWFRSKLDDFRSGPIMRWSGFSVRDQGGQCEFWSKIRRFSVGLKSVWEFFVRYRGGSFIVNCTFCSGNWSFRWSACTFQIFWIKRL